MIVRVRADRSVATHRAWRRASCLTGPVVPVAPDTRRRSALIVDQLRAMGLATEELRQRQGGAVRVERWWRAWTTAGPVSRVVLVNPQLAKVDALCGYLVELEPMVDEVVLLERLARSDSYEAVMSEVAAVEGDDDLDAPESVPAVRRPSSSPTVPRTGTITFLAAARRGLSVEEARLVTQRYNAAFHEAQVVFADCDPTNLLDFVRAAGSSSADLDDLLVVLHALRAAAWATEAPVRFDPHVVLRRAGTALLAVGDDALWDRLCLQVDANRAVAQTLAVLGWSVDDLVELTLGHTDEIGRRQALPRQVQRVLRVASAARRDDGAGVRDVLLVDPTACVPISVRTVGRWVRLAATDHLAPSVGNHLRWQRLDPAAQLRDLGVEWRGA